MDGKLIQYLSKFKLSGDRKQESYSHTSQMIPNTGKFRIEHSDMEGFWKFYCDRLWTEGDKFKSGLSERPNEYMPILADIDMAFPVEEGVKYEKHLYTKDQLFRVVKIYIDVLKYCVEDLSPEHLVCFVLEKKKPYQSNVRVKNGFHLHFPFLFMAHHEQDVQIIPRVIKQMEDTQVFKDIGIAHSGQVIDKSCTKKHWLMYGSRKDASLEAYRLTHILDCNMNEISFEEALEEVNLLDHLDREIKMVNPSTNGLKGGEDTRHWMEYYLPRILSIHPYNRQTYKCKSNINIIMKESYRKAKDYKGTIESMPMTQVIEMCKALMPMIGTQRANNRDEWIEIGWIVYNITQGCEEGLNLWIDFSRRTTRDNFSETVCIWQWNQMELRGYTIGSLRHYASLDSPEQFRNFTHEETLKRINESLQGGHSDLAKQLHDMLGTKFVCASVEKGIWFEFKNHRWVRTEKGVGLRARIEPELIPKYRQEITKCSTPPPPVAPRTAGTPPTEAEEQQARTQQDNAARIAKLNRIIANLKSSGFKDSVMKECVEKFYNADFLDLIDNDRYLIGFNNGVLDLRRCEFRAGKPDDYVSLTTKYDFKNYCDEDPEVQEVELMMIKFFPDPILRKYYMQYCARLLKGGNDAKTFLCAVGNGDNGKSIAVELIEKALGQYFIKLPTALLTGKRGHSSAASPELARTHGIRFAVLQEPDGSDTINGGILKELTGNDSMYIRGLYQDGKDVNMMLKLALICNKLPRLSAEDQAIWNRTRVLEFESRFPKNNAEVPESWNDQLQKKIFFRDPTISERFESLRSAFIWVMFRTYKECVQTGWMDEPTRVMEATNAYRKNNDVMLQFVSECIKQDGAPGSNLKLNDIFAQFKTWFTMTFHGMKMPSKNDIRDDLVKRWGPMSMDRWNGYRFRSSQDDITEGKSRIMGKDDFTDTETETEIDDD